MTLCLRGNRCEDFYTYYIFLRLCKDYLNSCLGHLSISLIALCRNLQDSFGSLVATPWIQLYRKQLDSRQSSDYSLFSQAAARQTFQPSILHIHMILSNTFSWWKRISSCIFDEVASKWDGLPYMDIIPLTFLSPYRFQLPSDGEGSWHVMIS